MDGEPVEIYKVLDSLLAFDVTPGEHEIEMLYLPRTYRFGLALSAVGTAALLLMIGAELAFRRKRTAKVPKNSSSENEE